MASPEQIRQPQNHVISEDADRQIFRIMLQFGVPGLILFFFSQFGSVYLYMIWPHRHSLVNFLSMSSMCVFLFIFYAGIYKLYALRLTLGRKYVEQQQWREAIASLDPFAGFMQRSFDKTGEAHYLLAKAYAAVGNKVKAESARKFVINKRPGEWANKLAPGPAPRASKINRRDSAESQDKKPRPARAKARRRF
jgi:hypothetical protein